MKAFLSFVAFSLQLSVALAVVGSQDVNECSCGFVDTTVEPPLLFTSSSIVYFNESDTIPTDQLIVESFEHRYDFGWNTLYRQGAKAENVAIVNDTNFYGAPQGLGMYCDSGDNAGLVPGASIRTARQDIFYGSFRSYMRAPRKWHKGSALSMKIEHNHTESWNMDIFKTDNSSQAWVSMTTSGEFQNTWLGTNFTNLTEADFYPFDDYLEYRVDWTSDRMDFYVRNQSSNYPPWKTYTNSSLPRTPAPLKYQHWSVGNEYTTQGPPGNTTEGNIMYTRIFFNSSLTNDTARQKFDEKCSVQAACSMDDNSLRGFTTYSADALKPWKQYNKPWSLTGGTWVALVIVIVFSGIFTVVTVKTVYRRFSWDSLYVFLGSKKRDVAPRPSSSASDSSTAETVTTYVNTPHGHQTHPSIQSQNTSRTGSINDGHFRRATSFSTLPPTYSGSHTPAPMYQTPSTSAGPTRVNSVDDLTIESAPMPGHGYHPHRGESSSSTLYMAGRGTNAAKIANVLSGEGSRSLQHYSESSNPFLPAMDNSPQTPDPESNPATANAFPSLVPPPEITAGSSDVRATAEKGAAAVLASEKTRAEAVIAAGKAPLVRARVDYLAGFIAISAILVTMNHFGQTFFDAVINPEARAHSQSEVWARKTFASYFLDPLWIGPFLMISTRFLVSNYLRTGKLDNMAQKVVSRPFRLLTPVVFIATLEYFLEDCGAMHWLEYLPSVSWSEWPFTTIVANPGIFISELMQLAYLIPNAAPNITYNYATGVLWTIPIQLQGAWTTLLALIMIKECKTPWKRCAFYAFCIVNHWYALSWGSYYYCALFLADLDLTFKYKTWLHARWWAYYPVLWLLIAAALGGFTMDMLTEWTGVNYATVEYGWHIDYATGESLSQQGLAVYPEYYIPRLNALISTVAMQGVVEICPTVQKVLSVKPLQWLFPHVFTIYLIHGFIFWSIGSWACVTLFSYGLPYWASLLATTFICYFVLFACLPILTPPIEAVGKNFTLALWGIASQEPILRKPTSYPFGEGLLKRDVGGAKDSVTEEVSSIGEKSDPFRDPDQKRNPFSDPNDSTKKKGPVFERIEEV